MKRKSSMANVTAEGERVVSVERLSDEGETNGGNGG